MKPLLRHPGLVLGALLVLVTVPAGSQAAPSQAAADLVPTDFQEAHTVYLAYAGAPVLLWNEEKDAAVIYSRFAKAISEWGRYKLVATPRDADLTLELSVGAILVGTPDPRTFLRVDVRTAKTNSLIWTCETPLDRAIRESSWVHNLDNASARITHQMKALTDGRISTDTTPKRLSDTK